MHHKNKTILWVGTGNLLTSYSAASQRTEQIVNYTTKQWGWKWHFATPSASLPNHTIIPNTPLPETLPHKIDILWFDRYFSVELFLAALTNRYPDARKLLDLQDIHSLREYRRIYQTRYQDPIHPDPNNNALPIALREYAAMLHMDGILSTATEEIRHLSTYFPNLPTCIHIPLLPNPKDENNLTYTESNTCYFIGNASQAPNKETVEYLVTHFWPNFHKTNPQFSLEIIGAGFENTLPKHNRELAISCLGTVENVKDTVKHNIGLFPLQHGAGTKGKILECLAYGNPCITTPIGAESISAIQGYNFPYIARSEKQLQQAIIQWSKPTKDLLQGLRKTQHSILQLAQNKDNWLEPLKRSLSQPTTPTNQPLEVQAITHFQTKYYQLLQRYIKLKNDT